MSFAKKFTISKEDLEDSGDHEFRGDFQSDNTTTEEPELTIDDQTNPEEEIEFYNEEIGKGLEAISALANLSAKIDKNQSSGISTENYSDIAQIAFDSVKKTIGLENDKSTVEKIKDFIKKLIEGIKKLWERAKTFLIELWNKLTGNLEKTKSNTTAVQQQLLEYTSKITSEQEVKKEQKIEEKIKESTGSSSKALKEYPGLIKVYVPKRALFKDREIISYENDLAYGETLDNVTGNLEAFIRYFKSIDNLSKSLSNGTAKDSLNATWKTAKEKYDDINRALFSSINGKNIDVETKEVGSGISFTIKDIDNPSFNILYTDDHIDQEYQIILVNKEIIKKTTDDILFTIDEVLYTIKGINIIVSKLQTSLDNAVSDLNRVLKSFDGDFQLFDKELQAETKEMLQYKININKSMISSVTKQSNEIQKYIDYVFKAIDYYNRNITMETRISDILQK